MIQVSGTWATPKAVDMDPSSSLMIGHDAALLGEPLRDGGVGVVLQHRVQLGAIGDAGLLGSELNQFGMLGLARQATSTGRS